MLIGLQVDYTMQAIIRSKMIEKLPEIWDIPIINTWDAVLDEGISKGKTNWQMFGSRKPGNEAYELTHHYKAMIEAEGAQFQLDEEDPARFDLKNQFGKLSVQYDKNPRFEINPAIVDEYNRRIQENKRHANVKKASANIKKNLIIVGDDEEDSQKDEEEDYIELTDIVDKETLERAVNIVLKKLPPKDYEVRETHLFTQALPERYYSPGSHLLNRQVAFALKHTSEDLFLSWVMLRSKSDDFDYNTIPELLAQWRKFHRSNSDGNCVTRRSIMYWVRKENPEEYARIKSATIEYYFEKIMETATEYDIALLLHQLYKDNYVCVSFDKKGVWFQFKNHRWISDKGLSLRSKISEEVFNLFLEKKQKMEKEMFEYGNDDERRTFLQKKIKHMSDISVKLKRTNDKNNIMREAAEIFYDSEFIKNMDR
jgi:hypothetical protein